MIVQSETRAQIPAVVVGSGGTGALGVIRSLAQANIATILIGNNPHSPAMHTRLARKVVISETSGPSLVADLLALTERIPARPVLFLTNDNAMLTVSEHRAELAPWYRFTLPSHRCVTSLSHKTTFQVLAESLGFPVPRSVKISSTADLGRVAELQFPAVVKPAIKTAEYMHTSFARAYKVFSPEEAEAKCRFVLTVVPELVVQEWIEGANSDLYFCLAYCPSDGCPPRSFVGRKLTIWPPDVGMTASCTAAPEASDIVAPATEAFFRRVSFFGIGGIEFKKDVRTGRFFMIEPTVGRVDAQEEVATIHGVNIPLIAYCHEAELPLPAVRTDVLPAMWRDGWAHWRATRADSAERAHTKSFRKVYDAYWRINDPVPALIHSLTGSIRVFERTFGHHHRT